VFWAIAALAGVVGVLVLLNAVTTGRLWMSHEFERSQKLAQTILLWLVPGAFLIVRHLLRDSRRERTGDPTARPVDSTIDPANIEHDHGAGHHSD
jgi:ABC-type nickel/cobalt efflux system permease component RcnA